MVHGTQGHWLFMQLLIPALERGAQSSPDKHSRVVHTSSSAIYLDPKIYWDTFMPGPARTKRSPIDLYNQSKAGNVVVSREAARRYADKNILFTAVNPGNIKTELTRHTTKLQLFFIVGPVSI
jgi:retinol dehydrogenase 12